MHAPSRPQYRMPHGAFPMPTAIKPVNHAAALFRQGCRSVSGPFSTVSGFPSPYGRELDRTSMNAPVPPMEDACA